MSRRCFTGEAGTHRAPAEHLLQCARPWVWSPAPHETSMLEIPVCSGKRIRSSKSCSVTQNEFIKAEKQWIKESCLYMVPALLIIIIGIFIAVLKQKHILIAIMSILFIGLTGLICKFICEMNRKIEAHMSYLKYRLKTMSTSSNSRS